MLRSSIVTGLLLLTLGVIGANHGSAASGASALRSELGTKERQIVLEFTGSSSGFEVGGPGSGVLSFPGIISDPSSGRALGRGFDTLDLNTLEGGDPFAGDNFVMTNTTTFNLPGGTITSQNRTSGAPFTQGTTGSLETDVTHMTSDFSRGVILSGTGRYQGISGTVRLSGAVDMSQFTGGPGSPISFNCLFLFDLD